MLEGKGHQRGAAQSGGQDSELRARRPEFCRRTLGIVTTSQSCDKSNIQPAVILIPIRVWSLKKEEYKKKVEIIKMERLLSVFRAKEMHHFFKVYGSLGGFWISVRKCNEVLKSIKPGGVSWVTTSLSNGGPVIGLSQATDRTF